MCEWYEEPVKIKRHGQHMMVPANELVAGDIVWIAGVQRTVHDILPDDDECIMYIKINELDAWPVGCFA